MATSVNAAFDEFLSDTVNLDPKVSENARSSRDWLLGQIQNLPDKHTDFPDLYSGFDFHYGSFARKTKTRELDDIDLIVGLRALGTTYLDTGTAVAMTVPDGIALRGLCHEGTNQLNSRKVINRFVTYLGDIPQYQKAELKRTGAAAVLNLSSYTWSFDIVPGFFTTPEADGREYYLIPDGNGAWMKTDPRLDRDRIVRLVQTRGAGILDVVRLIKYWNRRPTMPGMPSYLLESIILNYYESNTVSQWPDVEIPYVLAHVASALLGDVQDPKRIQGNINLLTWEDRQKFHSRAVNDCNVARAARDAESSSDQPGAIRLWGRFWGTAFPQFG